MTSLQADSGAALRLSHIVLRLGAGGTERLVIDMTRRLRAIADVQVICLDDEGEWAEELENLGVEVRALNRKAGFRPSLAGRISEAVRAHRSNVLHCHHYTPYVYGALAAKRMRDVHVVYTEHGRLSDAPPSIKRRLANLYFGRLPGTFVAVSDSMRSHMMEAGFPDSRLTVIHNGIDPGPPLTAAKRAETRMRLELEPESLVYGTIARLDPVKDLATLIRAFERVRSQVPGSVLILIGGGPEEEHLRTVVASHGLEDAVRFLGQQDGARALLPAMDVFVNCSLMEGISVTILEAMAAGLPVIATAVGGNPEIVKHSRTGILVREQSPGELSDQMIALSADTELRQTLGRAARERVKTMFAFDPMLEKYLTAYGSSFANLVGTDGGRCN